MKTTLRRNEGHKEKVMEKDGDEDNSGNVNEKPLCGLVVANSAYGKCMSEVAPILRLLVSSCLPI